MARLTRERLAAAYEALLSRDRGKVLEYWSENVRFEMPGNHQYAGWYEDLDQYLHKMDKLMEACGGVIQVETLDVLLNEEDGVSIDVFRLSSTRANAPDGVTSPYEQLEIEGVHLLRWRDGRIIEGRGGLFGDAATRANLWWSPVGNDGRRTPL